MNINMELIMACLSIMAQGMVGIFVVILVIWALVALLNKTTSPKRNEEAAPDPAPAAGTISNRGELIAAVSAAMAEELGEDISAIRITSFKKIG